MIHDDGERHGRGLKGGRRPGTRRVLRRIHRPAAQRIRPLIGLVAGLTLLVGAPLSALAALSPMLDGGVAGPQPYCARGCERLDEGHYIAYNDDFGSYTCLKPRDQQRSVNFNVKTWDQGNEHIGAYPNIFAGWEYGRHSARSWTLVADTDGSPEASVNFMNIPGGDYNAAWDIWLNRTDPSDPSVAGQHDGTEVMTWPINHTFFHPTWTDWMEDHPWEVMSWKTRLSGHGTSRGSRCQVQGKGATTPRLRQEGPRRQRRRGPSA